MDTDRVVENPPGRVAMGLITKLEGEIRCGQIPCGSFMPTVRQLAERHGVAKQTAVRTLQSLARKGMIALRPRKGYQVLSGAGDPAKGLPLAFLGSTAYDVGAGSDELFSVRLKREFEKVATARGWFMLSLSDAGWTPDELLAQLRTARVCGVIFDDLHESVLSTMKAAGMPLVVVDMMSETLDVDIVIQDGFVGSVLAAGWLAARGHKRVGWIGPKVSGGSLQVLDRFCGATGGLARAGASLAPEATVEAALGDPNAALEQALALLSRKKRPTAVLALWQEMSMALATAARQLGLVIGRDFEMVGWSTHEEHRAGFMKDAPAKARPPMVVWSIADMAATAVNRLMQRRAEPHLPTAHIKIRPWLVVGDEGQRS